MNDKRLDALDALRFIAASIVILTHFVEVFIVPKYGFDELYGIGTIECWLGIFSVLCFFYLSGYVIAFATDYSIKNNSFILSNYIKKRFFRIYPVVWGALIYALIIIMIMKLFSLEGLEDKGLYLSGDIWSEPNYISISHFLYSIFLPPSGFYGGFFNVPLWTISYEIGFYFLYGAVLSMLLNYGVKKTVFIVLFIIFSLVTWYSITISPEISFFSCVIEFLSKFPCWNFIGFLFVWLLGVGCFYLTKYTHTFRLYIVIVILFTAVCLVLGIHYVLKVPYIYNPYSGLSKYSCPDYSVLMTISYSLPLLALIYVLQFTGLPKMFNVLGVLGKRYSYSLYATHFILIILSFGILYSYLPNYGYLSFTLLFVTIYVVANIIAYFFAKLFENRDLWMKLFRVNK